MEPCPIERGQSQPGHDSCQVALATARRADVVPEIWHFSAVMECVHQSCHHGGAVLQHRGSQQLSLHLEPSCQGQRRIPGRGAAQSHRRREAPKGCEGAAVAGQDTFCPPPPVWLEHAAPAPPPGPRGTDTTVSPAPGQPWQSELTMTLRISWRDGAGHDLPCQSQQHGASF